MHIAETTVGPFRVYAAAIQAGDRFQPSVAVRDRRLPADAAPIYRYDSLPLPDPDRALQHALALGELAALNLG